MTTRNTAAFWTKNAATWQGEDVDLHCCEVRQETHDVKSFFFKTADASQFRFSPGQYITLELEIGGETINRCYTISSSPTRPHTLSITVKRHATGIVSNWLHDNVQIGTKIAAFGPHGEFTTADFSADSGASKFLFLSAGSGVTPLMSMSRAFHELAENQDVVFIHSARAPDDIIFRKELDLIAFNQPKFKVAFICEQIADALRGTSLLPGRLSIEALTQLAPDFKTREIFTCGPAPYMAAVRTILGAAGFDMAHYHEESFTFDELPSATEADADEVGVGTKTASQADAASFSVQFTKSERNVDCDPEQFVLDAALKAGLRLPFACSKGVCGTCRSKLLSGKVDMKHGGGIRQREIDAGMILICCSKPLTDLVVEK